MFFGEINKEEDGRLTIELTDKEIVGIVCGKGGVERARRGERYTRGDRRALSEEQAWSSEVQVRQGQKQETW